jgi:hypothetical protein
MKEEKQLNELQRSALINCYTMLMEMAQETRDRPRNIAYEGMSPRERDLGVHEKRERDELA